MEPDPRAVLEHSLGKPSVARVYDWYLDGGHHYEVDRLFGEKIQGILPQVKMFARENRRFLGRAVRYLTRQGIRQFVDIGSGLPSAGNVHEVAEAEAPGAARVVYVDKEPIAHAHAQLILGKNGDPARHRALQADLLTPDVLWPMVRDCGVLDPAEPIALLVVAVLHFVQDKAHPQQRLARYQQFLPAGSYLVLSHFTGDDCDTPEEQEAHRKLEQFYEQSTDPGQLRSREEFRTFFGGWPLVDPGIVYTPEWRPDETAETPERPSAARILAGVARRP